MAVAALLRSVARKLAGSPPPHPHPLLARGLQGGARSGPVLPPLPTPASNAQPVPPLHRLVHERGLHHSLSSPPNSGGSTPPSSPMDLPTALVGVASVLLFGNIIYMYASLIPRLDRIQAKLEVLKMSKLSEEELTQAIELYVAEKVKIIQSSGHGKQSDAATGNEKRREELYAQIREEFYDKEREELYAKRSEDLDAKITKLQIAFESPRSQG